MVQGTYDKISMEILISTWIHEYFKEYLCTNKQYWRCWSLAEVCVPRVILLLCVFSYQIIQICFHLFQNDVLFTDKYTLLSNTILKIAMAHTKTLSFIFDSLS